MAGVVVNVAVGEAPGSHRGLHSYRWGADIPARLENLFEAVSRGDMTPEESTVKTLRWLGRDGTLPEAFGAVHEISRAFHGIDRYEQLPLLPDLVEPEIAPPTTPEAPRRRQPRAHLLHVELRRRSRDDEIEVVTE